VPYERGLALARQFNVEGLLSSVLHHAPPSPGKADSMPTKDQVLNAFREPGTGKPSTYAVRKKSQGETPDQASRKQRKKPLTTVNETVDPSTAPKKQKLQTLVDQKGERRILL
jgi:hypothetical protein